MPAEVRVNHVGHAVADLDRARAFWTGAFDFKVVKELAAPDEGTSRLLGIPAPVGLKAVYLRCDDFVLELLHYADAGLEERGPRIMNEAGLTHLSLLVDDLDTRLDKVRALGGTVLDETRIGDYAILILDPDGQRVELLTNWEKP
ncbi:MAG: VOC family protein [Candidatus Binatia bacterium]|nr:VOC family protein [Candidatus Binatia bacterium]